MQRSSQLVQKKQFLALRDPKTFTSDPKSILQAIEQAVCEDLKPDRDLDHLLSMSAVCIEAVPPQHLFPLVVSVCTSSSRPSQFFRLLRRYGMLDYLLPELKYCVNLKQSKDYFFDVYEHCLQTLDAVPLIRSEVRIAALFHDIGKYESWRLSDSIVTFDNHHKASANLSTKWLTWLQAPPEFIAYVHKLILYHEVVKPWFLPEDVAEAFTPTEFWDLSSLWVANVIGTGKPIPLSYEVARRITDVRALLNT